MQLRAARRLGTLCLFQNAEGGSHEGEGQQQRQQRTDDGENHQQRQGNHEQQCGDEFRQAPSHMEGQADEAITRRMSGRRVCAKCGASYHIVNKPSAKEGVCDRCGGELAIRKDDEPATVLDRLKAYHEQTEPLVAFYRERGKLAVIPFCPSIEETTAEVMKALEA